MSNANSALVQQAQGIVASLGLRNQQSVLISTNTCGPPVAISDVTGVINSLVAAITALDP
jgi:hypothetical protein